MSKNRLATQEQAPASFADHVNAQTAHVEGFTEENQFRVRFPREGKIHLGVKKPVMKDGKQVVRNGEPVERPEATDYFVLPDTLLEDPNFQEALAELNADPRMPKRLPIWLPSIMIPDNIQTSWDRYSRTRGLLCRSLDGITARCRDEKTGETVEQPCLNKECPHAKADPAECCVMHRLRVMLPDASGIGVWQIDTKSPNNWGNLCCEMTNVKGMTGGKLAGLDLWLELQPEDKLITYKDKQSGELKQTLKTVHLMHIKTAVKLRDLRKAAAEVVVDWTMADVDEVDTEYDDVVHVNGEAVDTDTPDDFMAEAHGEEEAVDAGVVPEPDEPGPPACHTCGKTIEGTTINGIPYSVSAIVDVTTEQMGAAHCYHCFAGWKIRQQKASA